MLPIYSNLFYVYLSGFHKTLPKAEVVAIAEAEGVNLRVTLDLDQLLLVQADPELVDLLSIRAAFTRRIGKVLWVGSTEEYIDGVDATASLVNEEYSGAVKLEFRSLRGYSEHPSYEDLVKAITSRGVRIDRRSSTVVDVIISQGVLVAGLRLREIRLSEFASRWTNRRPVYLPGALNPDISRIFVNLSRASIRRGTTYYDPFCGVGSFLIEACTMGLRYVGSDIDERYVRGARANLEYYGCNPDIVLGDACRVPVGRADAIGTDMPYGRQTKPSRTTLELLKCFLESSEGVLSKGSYLVFAQDSSIEEETLSTIEGYYYELVELHRNWVHGSLTRNIYVLRRT
ncbi:MAG: hypothetical protein LM571_06370 [Desulfurococcaceae archaeon]|nr:hypothetical protein [Desulfurococcaceae archaeon]